MDQHQIDGLLATVDEEITNIQEATAAHSHPAIGRGLNNIKAVVDTLVKHVKANKSFEKKGKQSEPGSSSGTIS